MKEIIEFTTYFILCLVTNVLVFDFMNKLYKKRYNKEVYFTIYLIFIVINVLVNLLGDIIYNQIYFTLIMLIAGEVFYKTSQNKVMCKNLLFIFSLLIFQYILGFFIDKLLYLLHGDFNQGDIHYILKVSVIQFVTIVIYRLFMNFLNKYEFIKLNKIQFVISMIFPLYSILNVYVLFVLLDNDYENSRTELILISLLSAIILIGLNLALTYFFEVMSKNHKLESLVKLSEQQSDMQLRYYSSIEIKYNLSRKIMHDIKNHLQNIENLYKQGEPDKASQYTAEICAKIKELSPKFISENRVLNIIINDKSMLAESFGIQVKYEIEEVDLSFISDFDLTVILSNLIDNAIEACKEDEEVDSEIIIIIKKYNNFLIINIENSIFNEVTKTYENFISTKDGHSGIGISNVNKAIEKYNGDMQISTRNNRFMVNIVIPYEEK